MLVVLAFLALWVGVTLLLGELRWFKRREPLADRLERHVPPPPWVDDVEAWLRGP